MTKISGKWKSKEAEQFIILRKLADGSQLPPTAFESSRSTISLKEMPHDVKNEEEGLPHSSAVKRLDELLESGSIRIVKKDKKSKMQTRKTYEMTSYGFMTLLILCNEKKFLPDVMSNIRLWMPSFDYDLDKLKHIFTEEQLFNTIVSVYQNVHIEINRDGKGIESSNHKFPVIVSAKFMTKEYQWVHNYFIEIKVRQLKLTSSFSQSIPVGGKKKDMEKESVKPFTQISWLIQSAFFYELIMRCERYDEEFFEYSRNPGAIKFIVDQIINNAVLLPFFIQFLKDIKSKHDKELQLFNKLTMVLSKTRFTDHTKI